MRPGWPVQDILCEAELPTCLRSLEQARRAPSFAYYVIQGIVLSTTKTEYVAIDATAEFPGSVMVYLAEASLEGRQFADYVLFIGEKYEVVGAP